MFEWLPGESRYRAPAACRISVNGVEIVDLYPLISEVTVETSRSVASTAVIRFDGQVDETGEWAVQDGDEIRTRDEVLIEAVFGEDAEEVFRGYVLTIAPSYPEDRRGSVVTVDCRDATLLLDQAQVTRVWGDPALTTDLTIAEEIAADHALALGAGSREGQTGLLVNQNGSDISFLKARADANGFELYTRAGELHFGPPQLDLDPQPAIMVYAGRATNCLTIDISDDAHRADSVSFEIAPESGSDVITETITSELPLLGTELATGQTSAAGAASWRLTRSGSPVLTELQAVARARADEQSMRLSATGQLDGALYGHVLQFGMPVGVSGIGTRYGGRWYVDKVSHAFTTEGYRQDFTLTRNAYGDDLAGSGGVLGAVL